MAFIPKGEHMLRKLREARDEEGFTLIELLVVVLIIGILAAIAIPVFLDQRQKAYRNAAESDLRNLALVMEDYASDNNGIYSVDVSGDLNFTPSEGVTVLASATTTSSDGYCLAAGHDAFGGLGAAETEHWIYDASGGATNASVTDTGGTYASPCAAGLTDGATVTG